MAGGFIGNAIGSSLTIQNSVNEGTIDAGNGVHAGGFIGLLSDSPNIVVINNSINRGKLQSTTAGGGFVGTVSRTSNTVVNITNSVNDGSLAGIGYGAGGFIGRIYDQSKVNATIMNSINNCNVSGDVQTTASGFIGVLGSDKDSSIDVLIQNCVNNGKLTTKGPRACGFFCLTPEDQGIGYLKTTVENSINKGSVNASCAYGIASSIANANNIVSMGEVIGAPKNTFWEKCTKASLFYCLKDNCFNFTDSPSFFERNPKTLFYESETSGERVDDLLNQEAVNQQYGMFWTNGLDLDDERTAKVILIIDGEYKDPLSFSLGTPLGSINALEPYFDNPQYVIVNGGTGNRSKLGPNDTISRDMDVIAGQYVELSFGFPCNKTVKAVTGEVLERSLKNVSIATDQFIIAESVSMKEQHKTTIILRPAHYLLCHRVTVSGVVNKSLLVEHNQTLDKARGMSQYFTPAFIVTNSSNTNQVLKGDVYVTADLRVSITNVTVTEVVIIFDEIENITAEDVEDIIRDISSDLVVGVDVIRRDDGSYVVSIKSNDDGINGILDALGNCSNPSS